MGRRFEVVGDGGGPRAMAGSVVPLAFTQTWYSPGPHVQSGVAAGDDRYARVCQEILWEDDEVVPEPGRRRDEESLEAAGVGRCSEGLRGLVVGVVHEVSRTQAEGLLIATIRQLLQAHGEFAQAKIVERRQELGRYVPVDLPEADLRRGRQVQRRKSLRLGEPVKPAIVSSRHQPRPARILSPVAPLVHPPQTAFPGYDRTDGERCRSVPTFWDRHSRCSRNLRRTRRSREPRARPPPGPSGRRALPPEA